MAESLGAFEQAVMLAIIRLEDDAYGRAVLRDLSTRLKKDVAAGAVHATLGRLERKRLIASRLERGTTVRGGRAKRFYRLRPDGVCALNDAREAAVTMWRGIKWPLSGFA